MLIVDITLESNLLACVLLLLSNFETLADAEIYASVFKIDTQEANFKLIKSKIIIRLSMGINLSHCFTLFHRMF